MRTIREIAVRARSREGTSDSNRACSKAVEIVIASLRLDFPAVRIVEERREYGGAEGGRAGVATLNVDSFEQDPSLQIGEIDGRVRASVQSGATTLAIEFSPLFASRCGAVVTRYQRYIDLRTSSSVGPSFDRLLELHESIHDLDLPLVLADFEHSLDAWRWTVRLDPKASLACQIAALFHDVERLVAEPAFRVEHYALEYELFKNHHAVRGALIMQDLLEDSGLPESITHDACRLVKGHEQPTPSGAHAILLADADALSFFSLNSPGFLDYYGAEHTARKIAHTLNRMSVRARERVRSLWLRTDVRALVEVAMNSNEIAKESREVAP